MFVSLSAYSIGRLLVDLGVYGFIKMDLTYSNNLCLNPIIDTSSLSPIPEIMRIIF